MPLDIASIGIGVGIGAAFIFVATTMFGIGLKPGVRIIMQAARKKMPVAFLETGTMTYVVPIARIFKNLAITPNKEVIILSKESVKPAPQMGCLLTHGDLYKAITLPQDVRKFVTERLKDKWTGQEIAKFIEEIESTPAEALEKYYDWLEKTKHRQDNGELDSDQVAEREAENAIDNVPEEQKTSVVQLVQRIRSMISREKKKITPHEAQKHKVFIALSSQVKDWVYTGLNRVSIKMQLREMVYQRELEKAGQKNWFAIMLGIGIMMILLFVGANMFFGSDQAVQGVTSLLGGPSRVGG